MLLIYLKAVSENFVAFPPSLGAPTAFPPPHARRKGGRPRLDSQRGPHYPPMPTQPPTVPTVQHNEGGKLPFFLLYAEAEGGSSKSRRRPSCCCCACDPHYFCCCYYFFSLRREGPDRRATPEFEWFRKQALQTRTLKKPSAHLSKIAEQEAHFPPLLYVFPPTVNPERRSETFFHARACNQVARKATSKLGEETLQ